MASLPYRFGAFQLDPATRTLLRDGVATTLPPKALDLIVYLIERRDRAVGRDELIAAVWGRVDITDNALGQVVLQARRALDDGGEGGQRSIVTVPRFGYRWAAPVTIEAPPVKSGEPVAEVPPPIGTPVADAAAAGETVSAAPVAVAASEPAIPRPSRRWLWLLLAAALPLGLAALVLGWRSLQHPAGAAAAAVVVLPVAVDAPPDSAWVRLGVMDLVAQRLRAAGQAVVPSDNIVGLVARFTDANGVLDADALSAAAGAAPVVDASARQLGERWQVVLQTRGRSARGEGDDADVIVAARLAADRLALALGLQPPGADDASGSDRLLQQVRAAILSEQLDLAHRLLLEAGADARAQPEVRFRLAEIDFRAGRLDEAQQALTAQLGDGGADEPVLHARILNTLANIAYQRNQPGQVEDYSEQALRWLGDHDDPEETGRALVGRASARTMLDRYDAALADYAQARIAFTAAGDRRALARIDTYTALLDINRDRPAEALPPLRDAVERLRTYDAVVEELHGRVGIVMAELAMLDAAAALGQCARLDELAERVSDPRRRHYAGVVCVEALLANGKLGEAGARLRRIREQAAVPEASLVHQSEFQLHRMAAELAWAIGDARGAADEAGVALALPAAYDSAGARARTLLLAGRAQRALGRADAAAEIAAAARRLVTDAPDESDPRVYTALVAAEQALAQGDLAAADAAFTESAWAADDSRVPANVLAAAQTQASWLIERGELERAGIVVGRVARWATRSYEAALLQAQLYRALDQQLPWQEALRQAVALAGERVIPPRLRSPRPSLHLDDTSANADQTTH
ncbi:transcriptional regulator [Dokdonella sp.]|uniref:winged helix-turn-helix domain-containing protein n=1 Tax=Dokdonella sp. TaxID=2291710 RepID=UPI001B0A9E48|nr:transcriptional regulator [Dokdonella sp.]MBO9661914.1 winged helix-turn-helix domain-containing protein [Dokdonella sp.]